MRPQEKLILIQPKQDIFVVFWPNHSIAKPAQHRAENKRLIIQADNKNKSHTPLPNEIIDYGEIYTLPPKQKGGLPSIVLLG